jgi:hypothetical protein
MDCRVDNVDNGLISKVVAKEGDDLTSLISKVVNKVGTTAI